MKKNRRSRNKDHRDDHSEAAEEWCFVCKDGGNLVCCDHQGCSKVYHPRCIGKTLSFLKRRKLICSHHSCSECGGAAIGPKSLSCLLCPYALCCSCYNSTDKANLKFAVVRGKKKNHGLCDGCSSILDGKSNDPEKTKYFKECWDIIKKKQGLALEPHKSTLGKRKAEAECSKDNKDEIGSDDIAARNHKKHMKSKSSLQEEINSKEEIPSPSPTRNGETECCSASIVASNMKLVYLRRSLVEELISKQPDSWERKLVGSYVRVENEPEDHFQIKSSYQLSQVRGIMKNPNNGGEILLHLLTREVPISLLSDCDFTKEDCHDLQERVNNDLIKRPTVAEVEQKARELHEDITKDWIEKEMVRLQKCIRHERSQHGWISYELPEYLEQLELLKQPSEKERLLKKVPQVIAENFGP